MGTTEDEKTSQQKANDEIVVAKAVTKSDVLKAYAKGANYYDLAREFFDTDSEQALERVRLIVESDQED